MKLDELDIRQCPEETNVNNAFKNTHKCDRRSSRCVPILGRRFDSGGYKCECQQGFEYPYNDPITYFDGQILEAEYQNMKEDRESRFDTLKCRIAAGNQVKSNQIVLLTTLLTTVLLIKCYLNRS